MEYEIKQVGNDTEFDMRGRLTYTDHAALRDIIGRVSGGGTSKRVIFDFADVEFIDSSGLGMLLLALDAAKVNEIELVLRGAQGQVQRLFAAQKFNTMFICED